jgi:hypothetical protein
VDLDLLGKLYVGFGSMLHFSISLFGFSPFFAVQFFILCGRHLQAKTLDSLLCFAGLASSRVVTSLVCVKLVSLTWYPVKLVSLTWYRRSWYPVNLVPLVWYPGSVDCFLR